MTRIVIAICIIAAQLSAGTGPTAAQDKSGGGVDLEAMAKDVRIMERVLDQALNQHLRKSEEELSEDRSAAAAVAEVEAEMALDPESTNAKRAAELYAVLANSNARLARSSVRTNIDGYYIPGTGVIYTLDVPVYLKRKGPDAEEPATSDLWNQAENELHEKAAQSLWYRPSRVQREQIIVDEVGLNQTLNVLIDTIAEYGSRIEQLSASESIILAARVKGRAPKVGGGGAAAEVLRLQYMGAANSSRRVIVNVPVAVVREFAGGKVTREGCRERVEVTQYQAHAGGDSSGVYSYEYAGGGAR